jgi:hypothetical protein
VPVKGDGGNFRDAKSLYVAFHFKANDDLRSAEEFTLQRTAIFKLERIRGSASGKEQRQGADAK